MSDSYIQMRLRWRSTSFLDYLRNTLYNADKHTKVLDIPDNNLPTLSEDIVEIPRPDGIMAWTNALTGRILDRHRGREELEQVLHASAA